MADLAMPAHRTSNMTGSWGDDGPAIPRLPIPAPRGPIDHTGDSDPHADELLRRARESRRPRALVGA